MSAAQPEPPPDDAEGVSEPQASPQPPFHCAMPAAVPPRPRCRVQCAHCRHYQRQQTRVLPSEDGEWALVAPDGTVLTVHPTRKDADTARDRYVNGTEN